jgi:uncharacterized protein
MRVVLDTNILVRANPKAQGPARSLLLEIARSDQHTLILSPFLLEETERVLNYPRIQTLWPLSADEIQRYVQLLDDIAELVHPRPVMPVVLRDPNDDPVIETAILGDAESLCTLDQHFYAPRVVDFCRARSIRVISDVDLMRELRTHRANQ